MCYNKIMYESLKLSLVSWNDTTSDRDKLQHLYITSAVVLLVAAGVMGLVNQNLGQQILGAAIGAAALFIINAVAWALLQSFVLLRLRGSATTPPVISSKPVVKKPRSVRASSK